MALPSYTDQTLEAPPFDRAALLLTVQLLRPTEPQLAGVLEHLLKFGEGNARRTMDQHTLLDTLGAYTIGRIIAALTTLGEHWLEHADQPISLRALRQLLDQWIALGDWIVHHAHPR